jgi:hypothetical protein
MALASAVYKVPDAALSELKDILNLMGADIPHSMEAKFVPEVRAQKDDSPIMGVPKQENFVVVDSCICLIDRSFLANAHFQMVDPNYHS